MKFYNISESYSEFYQKGWLKPNSVNYIKFHDMEWFHQEKIISGTIDEFKPNIIPFAHTGGGDYWVWDNHRNNSVYLCYREDEEAQYYADDFNKALFKHLLEFCCYNNFYVNEKESWEVSQTEGKAFLKLWTETLGKYFEHEWIEVIKDIQTRTLKQFPGHEEGDYFSFISNIELKSLIHDFKIVTNDKPTAWC